MSVLVCCTGAPEALQHPDHTDREREHGAGGERESREKEERPQDWISKSPIGLLVEFDCCCLPQAFIILFFFPHPGSETEVRRDPRRPRTQEETQVVKL